MLFLMVLVPLTLLLPEACAILTLPPSLPPFLPPSPGYTALATAAFHPELVQACAVLNGAGSFDPPPEAVAAAEVTRLKVCPFLPPSLSLSLYT